MAYLLGRGSAVEWLRQNKATGLLDTPCELPMLSLEGSRHKLQLHTESLRTLTRPLHLIVALRENRRPSAETVCHLLSTPEAVYPAIQIEPRLFVSTPAFTFFQMASVLDSVALRFLGMELCGHYGIDAQGKLFQRRQTCQPEALEVAAQEARGMRGRRRALEVAPLVWGGAASPAEVALTLILCGPVEMGGYGIEPPELNCALPVEGAARELWGDDHITPDLLWRRAKLVIEYDSDAEHTAATRIARDASRRRAFEEMGYRVLTVTAQHMRTPRELERIASIIIRRLGGEMAVSDDEQWGQRMAYQMRIRRLAGHPEELLGFGDADVRERQQWHARHVTAYSYSMPELG